jgi:hypothetical protein
MSKHTHTRAQVSPVNPLRQASRVASTSRGAPESRGAKRKRPAATDSLFSYSDISRGQGQGPSDRGGSNNKHTPNRAKADAIRESFTHMRDNVYAGVSWEEKEKDEVAPAAPAPPAAATAAVPASEPRRTSVREVLIQSGSSSSVGGRGPRGLGKRKALPRASNPSSSYTIRKPKQQRVSHAGSQPSALSNNGLDNGSDFDYKSAWVDMKKGLDANKRPPRKKGRGGKAKGGDKHSKSARGGKGKAGGAFSSKRGGGRGGGAHGSARGRGGARRT